MSNRIDFFQSDQAELAIPAGGVSIEYDGRLCCWLELLEIVRGGWPEFSWARLAYNPAAYCGDDMVAAEDIETILAIGKRISIRQVYNASAPGGGACSLPVFFGQIESIETQVGPKGERAEVVATDFSANLKRITVYGRGVVDSDGSLVFLAGLDTIFNEDGKPNATATQAQNNGSEYTMFAAGQGQAKLWSCGEAIYYLLCEYVGAGMLRIPSLGQLEALTGNQKLSDFDVTGLNLLEALRRCCEIAALKLKFIPRPAATGPASAIVFYKDSTARTVELDCQPAGEQLSVSKTNIARLHSNRNSWPITHKYIGQGDFKVFEATFDLVKAWDANLEDTNYDIFSPSTNPDFYQVKDVYRKWTLNEAGDYTAAPYNQGDAFDFSRIFGTSKYAHRRRRFWSMLTTDKQGRSLGYFLQVSFDDGANWWQYLYAFNNLLDECGVWLSSEQLDVDTWIAALKGVLKFRITVSVLSDERVSCTISDGPVNSTAPIIEHVITLPRQFKYRKVSGKSIFANSTDQSLGEPDEVDDTTALYEFVRKKSQASSAIIETLDVQTPYLAFDYQTGDKVTLSPQSRDMLNGKSDSRSESWIERVQMDFEKQCTNLRIVRQRKTHL